MEKFDRSSLTFEQAEGLAPLPAQLERTVMSKELRAKLWATVYATLGREASNIHAHLGDWTEILKSIHVDHFHQRIDKYNANGLVDRIGTMFEKEPYQKVYGWLQAVMQHRKCPVGFETAIEKVLRECRASFRIENAVFWPIASHEEANAVRQANAAVSNSRYDGAKAHLQNATSKLTQGDFAGSVRESISSVESVARVLEPTGDLSKALSGLEQKLGMHPALKKGFLALYGYTSDQQGIRHALLENGAPDVEEAEAIFFIGACASFITYLIAEAKKAGI